MATGLYRTNEGWVQVAYGARASFPISRKRYEEKGYEPPFESLPPEHDTAAIKENIRRSSDD